jgi:hypothetical protein
VFEHRPKSRQGFRDTVEYDLPMAGGEKTKRIDLGLDLLAARMSYGQTCTYQEIAAWCGCTDGFIYQVEKRALRKVRKGKLINVLREFGLERLLKGPAL